MLPDLSTLGRAGAVLAREGALDAREAALQRFDAGLHVAEGDERRAEVHARLGPSRDVRCGETLISADKK